MTPEKERIVELEGKLYYARCGSGIILSKEQLILTPIPEEVQREWGKQRILNELIRRKQ